MSLESSDLGFWTGKGRNYLETWRSLETGKGYIQRFPESEAYLLRLKFKNYSLTQPLFNFEAIYSMVKGAFHDIKESNLSETEYNDASPIYLYEVRRGSEDWLWLGSLYLLLYFGIPLAEKLIRVKNQLAETKKLESENRVLLLEEKKTRLEIANHFPGSSLQQKAEFLTAKTPAEVDTAYEKLVNQGLQEVKISEAPFSRHRKGRRKMVNLKKL